MPKANITIGILAGGSGTRFWPAGRRSHPKQLLALDGDDPRSLLEVTFERLRPLSATGPRLIAPTALSKAFSKHLPKDAQQGVLWEPRPRNTAAAVALIALAAEQDAPKDPVLVVPADHHVRPVGAYRKVLKAMASRAKRGDAIVTLGLTPDHAATGYGYLALGDVVEQRASGTVHTVERYVEKPSLAKARRLVKGGKHLWNGGTFAFRPAVFLEELEAHLPKVAKPLRDAFQHYGKPRFKRALKAAYDKVPSISVDYGVMEQARRVEVVVGELGWDDLGSWDAIARHRTSDKHDNQLRGEVTAVNASNCLVDAADGHVALLGVEDLIVVRRKDTVLIAGRGKGEAVRDVVARLEAEGRGDLIK